MDHVIRSTFQESCTKLRRGGGAHAVLPGNGLVAGKRGFDLDEVKDGCDLGLEELEQLGWKEVLPVRLSGFQFGESLDDLEEAWAAKKVATVSAQNER